MRLGRKYLDWYESNFNRRFHTLICIAVAFVLILFAFFVSSCKTCKPIVEIRDSVRVEYKLDSVYVYKHDSIFRDRWRSGDTVYVNVERWAIRYKDKIVEVHDTISVANTEIQERKVVPAYYKGCSIALWIFVALAIVYIVVRVLIRVYLHK